MPTKRASSKRSQKSKKAPVEKAPVVNITDEQHERYRLAFQKIDSNNNGSIDCDELGAAMRSKGLTIKVSQLLTMVAEGDLDDNKLLNFDEFVGVMEAARSFRSSKAWVTAYDKFVGQKSQTLKSGFLFNEVGYMMTDPDDDSMRVGKLTCCDRFLVNLAGQYVDYGLIAATGGIYLLAMLWAWFMKRYVLCSSMIVLATMKYLLLSILHIYELVHGDSLSHFFTNTCFLNDCFGYHQIFITLNLTYILKFLHGTLFLLFFF